MTNKEIFDQLSSYIPGGVNSPVRAFKAVGGTPIAMRRGEGAYMYDEEGHGYLDFLSSWGPLILGHNHPAVRHAVEEAVDRGLSFGTPSVHELNLARAIVEAVPGIEKLRLVNSGTEATMTAARLARAYTERDIVLKVSGGYHGHVDSFLVQAGSGAATFGSPTSPGVTGATAKDTMLVPFNDIEALENVFAEHGDSIACFILEPIAGNMGMVPPEATYLEKARELTREHGALLAFDEVISGFRASYGGAQQRYGVTPDLTALGKIIGGGMPVGAVGGRAEIMDLLAPNGPVYQAGTLAGNPIAMVAGSTTLAQLREDGVYERLEELGDYFFNGLAVLARQHDIPARVNHLASFGTIFFTEEEVTDYASAKRSNTDRYAAFFHGMLERGVYIPPAQFECTFVSTAHTREDLDVALDAADGALRSLKQ
jgi:glutamate-1-semialdehyde 2,1-aminomutase